MRALFIFICSLLLVACGPGSPASNEPARFTTLDAVVNQPPRSNGRLLATVGYLYIDSDGARLVDHLYMPANAPPQPGGQTVAQVWIGPEATAAVSNTLRSQGAAQFAPVQALGQLQGPGHYGSSGQYRYQLSQPRLLPLQAQSANIGGLLAIPQRYIDQLVLVEGDLLTNARSAVLVEELEPGGAPAPATRQIKLTHPIRDQNILQQLQHTPNNATAFGRVRIEGFWHNSALIPLAITPLTS